MSATVGGPGGSAARYQLRSRIATGGMGEVWQSEDTLLGREVAVKVLKHEYADDPSFRARFEAEARNAAALHHPNVASVFDFGQLDEGEGAGRPFLVMELVPGEPLSALLRPDEPMPADRASDVVAQAADAVAAAHALGIVHRDVKPANLLVTPTGTVKITDFGIARAADAAAITQTGQIFGTPHYISPEQAEGHPATPASDIYALGVVLYECLAGTRPFPRDTPIQVALAHIREQVPPLPDTVPARLREIVDRALAKRPEDRFASAAELATALRGGDVPGLGPAFAAGAAAAVDAPPTRVMEAPPTAATMVAADTPRRRRPLPPWWPWAAAAAAVLLLVVGAAALTAGPAAEPTAAEESSAPQASASVSEEPASEDSRLRVRESDYVGRDADEVKKELEELGFDVHEEKVPATSPDQEKDTVAGVEPHGLVAPGSELLLRVWEEYEEPDEDEGPGKGKGEAKGKDD